MNGQELSLDCDRGFQTKAFELAVSRELLCLLKGVVGCVISPLLHCCNHCNVCPMVFFFVFLFLFASPVVPGAAGACIGCP